MDKTFDQAALISDLKTWWNDQVGKDDPFAPSKPAAGTISDALPAVDSLATVTALIVIEKHIPCEAPPSLIRPGGYNSFDDLIQDMLPKLEELANKHGGKQTSAKPKSKETT